MIHENDVLGAYWNARNAYGLNPCVATAMQVQRWALELVQISDDYQAYLDEADDLMDD